MAALELRASCCTRARCLQLPGAQVLPVRRVSPARAGSRLLLLLLGERRRASFAKLLPPPSVALTLRAGRAPSDAHEPRELGDVPLLRLGRAKGAAPPWPDRATGGARRGGGRGGSTSAVPRASLHQRGAPTTELAAWLARTGEQQRAHSQQPSALPPKPPPQPASSSARRSTPLPSVHASIRRALKPAHRLVVQPWGPTQTTHLEPKWLRGERYV